MVDVVFTIQRDVMELLNNDHRWDEVIYLFLYYL